MKDCKKLLVIKWGALGDLVAATTAIRALREYYPHADISVLSNSLMYQICPPGTLIDEIILYDDRQVRWRNWLPVQVSLVRKLRKAGYDLAINLRWTSERSAMLTYLSGARYRVGSGPKQSRFMYNIKAPLFQGRRHEFHRHLDIVEALDIHPTRIMPYAHCSKNDLAFAEEFFEKHDLRQSTTVGFHPGASIPSKAWPAERYAELAKRLVEQHDVQVVITWGREEEQLARWIAQTAGQNAFLSPLTKTVGELAAIIKSCGVFVCNYSGPMNVAMAVETPIVALGSTSAEDWGPYGEMHRTINKADVKDSYSDAERCMVMNRITVDEVLRVVATRLRELYPEVYLASSR